MNIQASGLLSLFSGLDGLENIQQSLLQDGVLPKQFASALLEQIELLQQGQSKIASPFQQNADLSQLQDFAGSLGKGLPGMVNQLDIDLEETMQALADVLNNINATDVESASYNYQALFIDDKAELPADNYESRGLPQTDNDALALAIPSVEVSSVLDVSQQQEAAKQAATLVNKMVGELPDVLEKNDLQLSDKDVKQLTDKVVKNNPVLIDKKVTEQALSMPEKNESETMMELNNDLHRSEKELLSGEKNQNDVEVADRKIMNTGTEKSLPNIAAELAMLNRTVASENKTDIPVMTRHFAHPDWGREISERVVWMFKQAVPSAELNLNPRHLGPISIRVDVNQDQATIAFTAQHAAVKEAIEAALPKLREMLGAQQLNLLDVNVSQQQSEQKQSQSFFQMAGDQQRQGAKEQMQKQLESGQSDTVISVADEIEAGRAIAGKGLLSIFA
jgi:flagellar hook-length control protein FliK